MLFLDGRYKIGYGFNYKCSIMYDMNSSSVLIFEISTPFYYRNLSQTMIFYLLTLLRNLNRMFDRKNFLLKTFKLKLNDMAPLILTGYILFPIQLDFVGSPSLYILFCLCLEMERVLSYTSKSC